MSDILIRLAALTARDDASVVPACPFCESLNLSKRHDDGQFWWHCDRCSSTGPALSRYSEEDEPCWESRPREAALIALVQEAADEIERLRIALQNIDMMDEGASANRLGDIAREALNLQEAKHG